MGCRRALPLLWSGWGRVGGLETAKAGGLQGGSGLAWTRDILGTGWDAECTAWSVVPMPPLGPWCMGSDGVTGPVCWRGQELHEPLVALYRQGD